MEGSSTKASYIGTAVNYETQVRSKTGKSGVWKTWHDSPHASTKGGVNKGRIYSSTYAPGAYKNTTSER